MSERPAPGVVTTADLYREISGLRVDVIRNMARLEQYDLAVRDHETRLRSMEQFRWKALGAVAAISAAVSVFVQWLGTIHHP